MEEISSLDSFGADSNARPDEAGSPKSPNETKPETPGPKSPESTGADTDKEEVAAKTDAVDASTEDEVENTANVEESAEENAEQVSDDSIKDKEAETNEDKESEKPASTEVAETAPGDDELDQISEGSLELDEENSQETTKDSNVRDESTPTKEIRSPDDSKPDDDDENHEANEAITEEGAVADAELVSEERADALEEDNAEEDSASNENDALASSDVVESSKVDTVDGAPASNEEMEVDDVEVAHEAADDADDIEMRSVSGDSRRSYDDTEKQDAANEEPSEGKDEVDKNALEADNSSDIEEVDEIDKEIEEDDEATAEAEADQVEDAQEVDHGEETVENVLEPEESDVCLIPDDPETEVTEAEKELARENAEKAAEQEEAAEQNQGASKSPVTEVADASTPAEGAVGETSASTEATVEDGQVAKESDPTVGQSERAEDSVTEINDSAGDIQETDEPSPEEEPTSAPSDEVGTTSKTIISWIVACEHNCAQCEETKLCGFRFKKANVEQDDDNTTEEEPSEGSYEYLCDSKCCDAFVEARPGKYFLRRKKFLVEEVANDNALGAGAGADADDDAATAAAADEDAAISKKRTTVKCLQCKEEKKCKYFLKQDQDTFYICNDDCFNLLNAEEPDKYKLKRHSIRVRNIGATTIRSPSKKAESNVLARTEAEAEAARLDREESFRRRCGDCHMEIIPNNKQLMWETLDFCNEICLGSYQRTIGAHCETCKHDVSSTALGKYCVRFGFDIRQFCCAACLNMFKKGLKTCSCCQKDISNGQEGFLAPVGDKDQFKDFCSQTCLRRYDNMCNPKKKLRTDMCGVCNNEKPVRVEMLLDDKEHYFCSNPCFSAFKFVSNVNADPCALCCKYFERKSNEAYTIYSSDPQSPKMFCSRICINVYIIVNRHIVSCQWCKVKKYNFDMICKLQDDLETLTCSINCLTMHGVSCNISARAVTKCDNCDNASTPQYHLTMSDASMRNFCTYQCVMQFQSQFARTPLTLDSDGPSTSKAQQQQQSNHGHGKNSGTAPFPTGLPKRVKLKLSQQTSTALSSTKKKTASVASSTMLPVISTVQSLASGESEALIGGLSVRRNRIRGRKTPPPLVPSISPVAPPAVQGRGRPRKHVDYSVPRSPSPTIAALASRRSTGVDYVAPVTETKIITVPPYPKSVRNVNVSCKPMTTSTGQQCTPSMVDCAIQTDKDYSNKVLIPVPVPIFVPQPMYMYSAPFPVPVPIPLPIPVPIFIPTTRNTAQGILKEIKKIQDKMPEDPLEAELLMMAELVAEEKHDSDSDSDNEIKPDPGLVSLQYQNSLQQQQQVVDVGNSSHNPYGDDMLQIALKMATGDYDNPHQTPTVDLESSMTANTIPSQSPGMVGHDSMSQMGVHHIDQQHHMLETPHRAQRGRKRAGSALLDSTARNNRSSPATGKRQRCGDLEHDNEVAQQHPKPDAQMFLKYTFGVNAWKQWVLNKNADMEKSSMRRRPFKDDLMQMTADELNYTLCLFVKEVRKPNGTEYAPDTIYYLVLGIQQYLYENGRIDNIFYDPYYERFTECLDEVARKFSVLYNDSQYIVTRVEEEHLWECKQLGAHSPHVLLSTLMFFNTKHFNLTTVEEHMQLSFSHIMKHWKRASQNSKVPGTRNVLLRFYPPQAGIEANPRKKKVYEQQENEENPLRCPVRLYEFYLSKCPESVKTRNDVFYLQPERSCVPDSPVWYSTQALSQDALQRMLHRVKMVKEINIALLTI